jgi:hypothetical protein
MSCAPSFAIAKATFEKVAAYFWCDFTECGILTVLFVQHTTSLKGGENMFADILISLAVGVVASVIGSYVYARLTRHDSRNP